MISTALWVLSLDIKTSRVEQERFLAEKELVRAKLIHESER
jgi:hypothetical protein